MVNSGSRPRALLDCGKTVANLDEDELRGEQPPSLGGQLTLPPNRSFVPLVAGVDKGIDVSGVKEDRFALLGHARSSRGFRRGR